VIWMGAADAAVCDDGPDGSPDIGSLVVRNKSRIASIPSCECKTDILRLSPYFATHSLPRRRRQNTAEQKTLIDIRRISS